MDRVRGKPPSSAQPVLWTVSCRGCSCSAWKQTKKMCVSWPISSFFPPFHPLLLNVSKQVSPLRPELCTGTKQSTGKSHFKTSPSPACLGEAELPGAAQTSVRQGGQEAAACNVHRGEMLSAAVLDKRRAAVPSLLAWDRRSVLGDFGLATQTWGWGSPPVVLSSYCCCIPGRSSALFYGRSKLSLNQAWARVFIKAAWGCLSVSRCWAQQWCAPCCHMPSGRATVPSPVWGWDWCECRLCCAGILSSQEKEVQRDLPMEIPPHQNSFPSKSCLFCRYSLQGVLQ